MQSITPFLWFDGQAQEAAKFYTSIFKNSQIDGDGHSAEDTGFAPEETVMSVTFWLDGLKFIAFNGGPQFTFTPALSLFVSCETQAEVDELWMRLSEGGKTQQCGWLEDKFGVSWQIVPSILGDLLGDEDDAKSGRVMEAMLQMEKLEIRGLQEAYEA